jgi:PEP-CTERM/exosortase A-associated glycosyltransferase
MRQVTKEFEPLPSKGLHASTEDDDGLDARHADKQAGSQSPLKILHILDHSLPLHSGYSFRTQNILREQRKRGWNPVALTCPKHEASWKRSSPEKEEIGGIRHYRTGAISEGSLPFEPEVRLMKCLAKRIEQVAEIEKPDLLHAHSPVLNALPALWVGRKLGIPTVYEIRAFWEDAGVDHQTYSQSSWKYKLIRALETWTCRQAAQIAVLCNGLKSDLIQRGIPSDKLTIVWNGVNPGDFLGSEPDLETAKSLGIAGKKVLGYIGSFYRYEGLDLLVRAVEKLVASRKDIVLVLAGGGEMEQELRDQVLEMKLQDRVIFTGRIPHEKTPAMYSLIDIMVYPRYSMRLTELVTPLKPLESMAMGKPIVASDIGGHRELIQNGYSGILFKAGDASSLAATLEHLLNNADLRNRLAAQGSDWVRRNHSWEKTTSVYSEIYSKALEGRASRAVKIR